jgi:molecular chaperone GrpE
MDKTKSKKKKTIPEENPEVVLLKNQLARTLADYDNLRKRTEEEKTLWIKFSSQRVLTTLLPILDNFESAQKHLNDSGLAIAIGEFKRVFAEEGLEEITPKVGDDFNHDLFEAIDTLETDKKEMDSKIAEVVLPGWKFKNDDGLHDGKLVVRYAKVKVYKKI